jgi:hypothetical protein
MFTNGAVMAGVNDQGALTAHGEGGQHRILRQEQGRRRKLLEQQLDCLLPQVVGVEGGLRQHEGVLAGVGAKSVTAQHSHVAVRDYFKCSLMPASHCRLCSAVHLNADLLCQDVTIRLTNDWHSAHPPEDVVPDGLHDFPVIEQAILQGMDDLQAQVIAN